MILGLAKFRAVRLGGSGGGPRKIEYFFKKNAKNRIKTLFSVSKILFLLQIAFFHKKHAFYIKNAIFHTKNAIFTPKTIFPLFLILSQG